jgi:hypothetical protein
MSTAAVITSPDYPKGAAFKFLETIQAEFMKSAGPGNSWGWARRGIRRLRGPRPEVGFAQPEAEGALAKSDIENSDIEYSHAMLDLEYELNHGIKQLQKLDSCCSAFSCRFEETQEALAYLDSCCNRLEVINCVPCVQLRLRSALRATVMIAVVAQTSTIRIARV